MAHSRCISPLLRGMPTLKIEAQVESSSLRSADGKTVLLHDAGSGPMARWSRDLYVVQRRSQQDDCEPPRKRAKLNEDDDAWTKDTDLENGSIPIAHIVLDLFDKQVAGYTPDLPDPQMLEHDSLSVELIAVDTIDENRSRFVFAGPSKSHQMVVEAEHHMDDIALSDLRRVAFFQRRSRQAQKCSGPVQVLCSLRRQACGGGWMFRIQISIVWLDGESTIGRRGTHTGEDLATLTRYFPLVVSTTQSRWSPQDFYDSVHSPPADLPILPVLQGHVIESDLYPFQKRAVQWMLGREGRPSTKEEQLDSEVQLPRSCPLSFTRELDADNRECFVSHLQGVVATRDYLAGLTEPRGGILAEEMGLGKTCELISLICLNKRRSMVNKSSQLSGLHSTSATLIVTPLTILEQWKNEIHKHAPHLTVAHYSGLSKLKDENASLQDFREKDIILTTYSVLTKEVHYAVDPPDRSLRKRQAQPPRKRSPLVQMHWWRVCLDEAQMVESGVSAAAKVAALLPRENAWAVSGTPLRKNVQDLLGLLVFLKYRPFCDSPQIWTRLVDSFRDHFKELFGRIALRHTKDRVRQELKLPAQRRVVLTVPFTAIEEQNYRTLFTEMADDCGCSSEGSPLHGLWDPELPELQEKMRAWLVRLRQTCLHPQVGGRNRVALGRGTGPLRTVAEVLEVMIEQSEFTIRTESRAVVMSQLLRAHITGNAKDDEKRSVKALDLYLDALRMSEAITEECRIALAKLEGADVAEASSDKDETPQQGLKRRLHHALELQHACLFYTGTAYFQIKSNEALTTPDSDEYRALEEREVMHYETAKAIRRELLKDNTSKVENLMRTITERRRGKSNNDLPPLSDFRSVGGIENRKLETKMRTLSRVLSDQAELIDEWSEKLVNLLLKPLVDEDDGIETTGDEYEDSTKQQDEMYAYFDALRALIADRSTCLSGLINPLVDYEVGELLKEARSGYGHAPELSTRLLTQRNALKQKDHDIISFRGLLHEARGLESALEWQSGKGSRADAEAHIVRTMVKNLQTDSTAQTKALTQLERDRDLYRGTMNQRLEFYRLLQVISDAVTPYKEELDDTLDTRALESATSQTEAQRRNVATLKAKHRFFLHLRSGSQSEGQRICVICQSHFEQGVLTICGHQYCKDCIQHWWAAHKTCPVCKRHLNGSDFHPITYKPQHLRAHEEIHVDEDSPNQRSATGTASIYSNIDASTLAEIKCIDLRGSFGTKIDTLSRHILHLRTHDPGAKSIVFSQFREFLDVLGTAFTQFGIGHSRMGRTAAIERFRQDPSVECFLLDAKTDSSGLNLVNATHVFLCEPLINTAIELQAIARVHRIGQRRSTTVYMYLISDTVEEAIYDLSVTRRLEHLQRARKPLDALGFTSGTNTPALGEVAIDAANSLEMQQAPMAKLLMQGKGGGEMVAQDDLWSCLFGKASARQQISAAADKRNHQQPALQAAVDRHVRAEAAEKRMVGS